MVAEQGGGGLGIACADGRDDGVRLKGPAHPFSDLTLEAPAGLQHGLQA